jgi:hypothetical protein
MTFIVEDVTMKNPLGAKIRMRCLSYKMRLIANLWLSIWLFSSGNAAGQSTNNRLSSDVVCKGGVQYEVAPSCTSDKFACKSQATTAVPKTCSRCDLGWTATTFNVCPSRSCNGYRPKEFKRSGSQVAINITPTCGPGEVVENLKETLISGETFRGTWDCVVPEFVPTCANASCGASECSRQDAECGFDTKFGECVAYLEDIPSDPSICSQQPTSAISVRQKAISAYPERSANRKDGYLVDTLVAGTYRKDHLGIGSVCVTCDDIPVLTTEDVERKFDCLEKAYKRAGEDGSQINVRTFTDIISGIRELYRADQTPPLTGERFERAEKILSEQ